MSAASIPVDLFNPGQVFACLGFMELAEVLTGPSRGAFDWSDPGGARFLLHSEGAEDPFAVGLAFLSEAEVHALAPPHGDLDTGSWGVESKRIAEGEPYPIAPLDTPAMLPAVLATGAGTVRLHSWGESSAPGMLGTRRDNVKFWAGAGGYPGVALLRDALDLARPSIAGAREDPFSLSAPQSSSFRFDWRRDYIPIDIGFSLNLHGKMQPRGYPLVEILAVIGLSHARPLRVDKLEYRYAIAGRGDEGRLSQAEPLLPAPLLRAALGVADLPFPTRTFRMRLDWPGQENQARCITTVDEETD
jgi:CRISPR-associated protein Csb3